MLASVGTALGIALAAFGISELRRIAPASLPRLDSIRLDPVVLAFSVAAGLAAAILFGLLPALRSTRPDVITVLRASGRTSSLGGARLLRNCVVVVEVALSFVLLIGSGLMFRSFLALQKIDPGFDPHRLLTFQVFAPGGPSTPEQRAAAQQQLRERLAALPGVQSATASSPFPLTGNFNPIRWGLEPALADPSLYQAADSQIVQPGYFAAMRTPILDGREFTDADNAPGRYVRDCGSVPRRQGVPPSVRRGGNRFSPASLRFSRNGSRSSGSPRISVNPPSPSPDANRFTSPMDTWAMEPPTAGLCAPPAIPRNTRRKCVPKSPASIPKCW